jgi:hypothetical protein
MLLSVQTFMESIPFETQPSVIYVLRYKRTQEASPSWRDSLSQPLRDIGVKVTLVARPLITLVDQKMCGCERGAFTSRTRVYSGT